MSILKQVSGTAQQVAEAIEAIMGVNVMVVDEHFERLAATGEYRTLRGSKVMGCASRLVFESAQRVVVREPRTEPTCAHCKKDFCRSEALILYPISVNEKVVGVIGVEATNHETAARMMRDIRLFSGFLEKMAELLAAKASEQEGVTKLSLAKKELEATTELIPDGIVCVDDEGVAIRVNHAAMSLLGVESSDILGRNLFEIIKGSLLSRVLRGREELSDAAEVFRFGPRKVRVLVSARPLLLGGKGGAVMCLRDPVVFEQHGYRLAERDAPVTFEEILGDDPKMRQLREKAQSISRSESTVLIRGETGTGKGLLARAIHCGSRRKAGPFVAINCAAVPETLLESELFGYEDGAFTGAKRGGKPGRFELANGGTLFLDEIGDIPLYLQAKLLRVIETRSIERVGGVKPVHLDFRLIAATNRDLERMIRAAEFRADLFYRLNVIPIVLPPVRERSGDIMLLADHFCRRFSHALSKNVSGFTPLAETALKEYDWPGNVRELENAIEYAVNLELGDRIDAENLPNHIRQRATARPTVETPLTTLRQSEEVLLRKALEEYGTSLSGKEKAARALGISRATLYRRLRQLDIAQPKTGPF